MSFCSLFKKKKECNVILSAGGIRSLAQIGALEALEEDGWKIKSICGISAGAIVASFYANGTPLEKMKQLSTETDFNTLKKWNFPKFNEGLFKFNGLGDWVADNSMEKGYTKRCELNIGTCSLSTANRRIFTDPSTKQELSKAIEATCCIPMVFVPVEIDGERYADGALWSSAPVHFYEQSKLITFVIHVQNSHTYTFANFHKPVHTLYRVFEVFQINRLKGLKKRIADKPVCIVEPNVGSVSALAFKLPTEERRNIIATGKASMVDVLKNGCYDGTGNKIF